MIPTAPQRTRTVISAHLNEHVVTVQVRAFSMKFGERSALPAQKSNQLPPGKANANASAQIETLTTMATLLLREWKDKAGTYQATGRDGRTKAGTYEANLNPDENIHPRDRNAESRG
ncbi:hypothetical protein K469DRAFT_703040 [Zopfia rhizophila CBS 207.26]|uniref:Uncharacterized protein n=1 Tax=Zopfia rhizophila CBS 207.26 TaxID=1314779 RepID=A0A6A6D7R6_9PEZI|nr:hypothetical protein K469DRAFT_703040 [Zopfia rhizophila CBS 207.26]